jgi:hypothetical protein
VKSDKKGMNGTHGKMLLLLGVRRSGKFLRSFGKQWEAKLPTLLLIINENGQRCAKEKNTQQRAKSRGWCTQL